MLGTGGVPTWERNACRFGVPSSTDGTYEVLSPLSLFPSRPNSRGLLILMGWVGEDMVVRKKEVAGEAPVSGLTAAAPGQFLALPTRSIWTGGGGVE